MLFLIVSYVNQKELIMKKVIGIIFAIVVAGALLSGCYQKTCDQPQPQPQSSPSLKGEG
jgi:hypothetical protein